MLIWNVSRLYCRLTIYEISGPAASSWSRPSWRSGLARISVRLSLTFRRNTPTRPKVNETHEIHLPIARSATLQHAPPNARWTSIGTRRFTSRITEICSPPPSSPRSACPTLLQQLPAQLERFGISDYQAVLPYFRPRSAPWSALLRSDWTLADAQDLDRASLILSPPSRPSSKGKGSSWAAGSSPNGQSTPAKSSSLTSRRASENLHFFNLRDASSIVQLVSRNPGISSQLMDLPLESVVLIEGTVKLRKAKAKVLDSTATGEVVDVEVEVDRVTVLNTAEELPFYPSRPELVSPGVVFRVFS